MASWVPPSPFVLTYVKHTEPWGFSPATQPVDCSSGVDRSLGLHLRDRARCPGSSGLPRILPLCVGVVQAWHAAGAACCLRGPIPPVRFRVPLAIVPLESGRPGLTSPGIFRPWAFSTLRRFTPPNGSPVLFHTGTTSRIQRTRACNVVLVSRDKRFVRRFFVLQDVSPNGMPTGADNRASIRQGCASSPSSNIHLLPHTSMCHSPR
jgi:hypothetical protein